MKITKAAPSDLDETIGRLVAAFAHDPITGFLLQTGLGYRERVTQFFSMLMRARIALNMPVLVARDTAGIHGAAMGYSTISPAWSTDIADEWDRGRVGSFRESNSGNDRPHGRLRGDHS